MKLKNFYQHYLIHGISSIGLALTQNQVFQDIIACVNGHFVGIEVKAPNGHPSELQKRNIKLIHEANGYACIVYPKDFEKTKKEA